MLQTYKLNLYSKVGGVNYGEDGRPYASCGVVHNFSFSVQGCAQDPSAILGCTDPMGCNYDMYATCDDGSCYYPFNSPSWFNPQPGVLSCIPCQAGGGCPSMGIADCDANQFDANGNPTLFFAYEADCNSATGPQ